MTGETTFETTESLLITGGVGSGKTQRLVERAAALLTEDAAAHSVLVLCATPQAAHLFSERLAARAGAERASGATVTTARALALDVLADDDARRWSGREPRLLSAFEETFLMEDMKVSGLRPRRLREMLKFFYRSWTELADDDPAWLLPGEETDVHALLKANLSFMRAIVEPEAANLAVRYLRGCDEARAARSWAHVLVDDFACASRASQTLASLVAARSIAVAGDAETCIEAYDSYPYADGIDEFLATHPHAVHEHLAADAAAARTPLVLRSDTPEAEFELVARTVSEALAAGTSARRIVVAVPNGVWSRNVVAALAAQGVRAEALPDAQPLRGDIHAFARCVPARIATALNLAANPDDAAAWRCWCGFGDHLVNSAALANLRSRAEEQGVDLVQALAAVDGSDDQVVGAQRVAEAHRAGRALIEQARGLTGEALLDELTRIVTGGTEQHAPAVLRERCLADDGSGGGGAANDAAAITRRLAERLLAPTLEAADAVAVVPYDLACGFSPDLLIVAGFVNGFIPSRDYFDATVTPPERQEKMRAVDERRVRALTGKAGRTLALSYFTSTDLESAGKLKLKINRIRLKDGIRTCAIEPSMFLDETKGRG